ncbi:MAG: 2-oxoacid:acceptor oxidoreductase subunit alpha, partial [Nitrospiraceae bacterium]|nr:2-oxoacid:acceptor oxidoreductase subunit alpha [Nitrospiraceae bacterium]
LIERLNRKIMRNAGELEKNEEFMLDDADIAVIAFGTVARSAKMAIRLAREKGIKAGLLKPLTIWPSPEKTIGELSSKVKAIIVPELNMGQYVLEVERCAKGKCPVIRMNRANGTLFTPYDILERINDISKLKISVKRVKQ